MNKRSGIRVVLVLTVVVLAGTLALTSCAKSENPTSTSESPITSGQSESTLASTSTTLPDIIQGISTIQYRNEELGFSIGRPASSPTETEGFEAYLPLTKTPVVGFTLTPELFAGTNLIDAGVYIGASSDSAATGNWDKPVAGSLEEPAGTAQVNGVSFAVFTSKEAVAGNIYEEKIYRALHGDTCFEIVELFHSGNIANYEEGTVVEFDKAEIEGYLDVMVGTFSF